MSDLKEQMSLEHYKFILSKIQYLDESLYKNLTFTSKFITAIVSFIIAAILLNKSEKIPTELLVLSFDFASFLIMFVCITFFLITIAILLSWFDYRNEEIELMNKMGVDIGRKPPTIKNLHRWTESWFLIVLIIIFFLAFNLKYLLNSVV